MSGLCPGHAEFREGVPERCLMRFLADENFPGAAITALKAAGHDVTWIKVAKPGASDKEVLTWATREERVLLTFDKDFGELAGRAAPSQKSGVVLLRISPARTDEGIKRLVDLISAPSDWIGHFSIIEPGRVRMRPLPFA
jgi:predicted nuclease of predicted toxin-antitoxin system